MKFQEDFFRQILGIVIGTNLAPILIHICMAILKEELYVMCKNVKIKIKTLHGLNYSKDSYTMDLVL